MIEPRQAYPFLNDEDFMLLVQRLWAAKQQGEFARANQIVLHVAPQDGQVKAIEYLAKASKMEKLG